MQLSKRLLAIANMVTSGNRVVDVGCDHGYIPIWLLEQKIAPSAIAMDINQGPLLRAKENIRQHGLSQYIETRLSDGVAALKSGEGDTLVIAGMGGPLMEKILTEGAQVLEEFSEFILEPQSELGHMRLFLQEHAYEIREENMVFEDGKYYPIMRVVHGTMNSMNLEEQEYGPCLLRNQHPVLKEYLLRELEVANQLAGNLQKIHSEKAINRLQELEKEIAIISCALAYYDDTGVKRSEIECLHSYSWLCTDRSGT